MTEPKDHTDQIATWIECLVDAITIGLTLALLIMLCAIATAPKADAASNTVIAADAAALVSDLIVWFQLFAALLVTAAVTSLIALIPADRFTSKSARRSMIWLAILVWPLAVLLLPIALLRGARARKDGGDR